MSISKSDTATRQRLQVRRQTQVRRQHRVGLHSVGNDEQNVRLLHNLALIRLDGFQRTEDAALRSDQSPHASDDCQNNQPADQKT